MQFINGPKESGKTRRLIELAAQCEHPAIITSEPHALQYKAKNYKIDGWEKIEFWDYSDINQKIAAAMWDDFGFTYDVFFDDLENYLKFSLPDFNPVAAVVKE